MTSWVVADSGILLAGVLVEKYTSRAQSLMMGWQRHQIAIAAPSLLRYEVVAALRKHVYRQTLTPQEALRARDELLAYPVEWFIDVGLLKRGYEFAVQFNFPTAYDAQYLAVAERLDCEFWTADERLYNALNAHLTWVKWVGNFAP
jgi:predicted nucleic acid-binding protein